MTAKHALLLLVALALSPLTTLPAAGPPFDEVRRILAEAEPRIRAIFERREFRPAEFSAEWLPDSSGYRIQQRDPRTHERVERFYEVHAGKPVAEAARKEIQKPRQPSVSPDGKWMLESKDRHLFLRELSKGEATQVTSSGLDRDVSYRGETWRPDGTHAVFVEVDATDVRRRAVLVPEDPSYPGVRRDRFARVGEKIESLRLAVVDIAEKQTKWLPIETPPEGFYFGQVEWAGNSKEILVEMMSRFRDTREFLLVNVHGQIKKIYSETNAAWAESALGKNSELTWVRNGEAFVVVTEKDGWRHAYLFSREGKELSLLTPGGYDVIDRAVVDEHGGWYYFYASPDNGTHRYLYRVPLDGSGTPECVTPKEQRGTHD
jgi:dipeptidyl-peptidase-4